MDGRPSDGGSRELAATIRRPRVESLLDAAASARLTLVLGAAGSGKTTVLAQWTSERDVAWHTVSRDETLATFARGVFDAMLAHVAGISPDVLLAIEGSASSSTEPAASRSGALAGLICEQLAEHLLGRDLIVVIDDAQWLVDAPDATAMLDGLARHAPPSLHLVVASRTELPFATSRLELEGHACRIDPHELAFTPSEVAELLGVEGDDAFVDEVISHTGGWAVATAFAARAARTRADAVASPARSLDWADGPILRFLAEEVIAAEEPALIHALRRASELPWITPELARHLGFADSSRRIFASGSASIYAAPVPTQPGAVIVSPLVAEFVRLEEPLGDSDRVMLFEQAGNWYRDAGAWSEAASCYRIGGDVDGLVAFLVDHGASMIAEGRARQVIDALQGVPDERRDRILTLLEADAHQMQGDWESAAAAYDTITPATGPIPADLAWRSGLLHYMRGDVEAAFATYRRGQRGGGSLADEAALLAWTASAHFIRAERDAARSLAYEAASLARRANDSRALATSHTVLAMVAALDGDIVANDAHYVRALEHAARSRDVVQTVRIRCNRGSSYIEKGDWERGQHELDMALQLADAGGLELWRALSLSNRAEARFALGALDEAIADLEQSRAIFRSMGSRLESYPLGLLGDVYAARGATALARAAYEQAADLAGDPPDLQALVPALAGLARVLADDEPDVAAAHAERATAVAPAMGYADALLALGWVELARGHKQDAMRASVEAAEVARARRDRPSLAGALELEAAIETDADRRIDVLGQARSIWADLQSPLAVARVDLARAEFSAGADAAALADSAAATFERLGAKGAAARARQRSAALMAGHHPPVAIRLFGGFSLSVDGTDVPSSAWQSRVARDLLKMLAANRGRPLHREVLIDRLWPDDDVDKAANRLSVALTTMRSVLDPGRGRGNDFAVIADRECIQLDLDDVAVDADQFLVEASRADELLRQGEREQGLAVLRRAESRYAGEPFEEQPYAEWAQPLREETRAVYLTIGQLLAAAAAESGDHDSAVRQYLRLLECDDYHEPAHLGLVAALAGAGRHGTAHRRYRYYVSKMGELEVEPSAYPAPAAASSARHSAS
jgi:ATP/maltotriose-dependent transcriptional regulator MalT/DNA-binding SARP family transcriptional activator